LFDKAAFPPPSEMAPALISFKQSLRFMAACGILLQNRSGMAG